MLLIPKLEVTPYLPIRGIHYIGQYGTSGYATAAKGYLYHYHCMGTPITWDPLHFDDSEMEDSDPYNVVIKSLINKDIECDFGIIHCTPDLWPSLLKKKKYVIEDKAMVEYCTWETSQIPDYWVECINESVWELWVSSTYNKEACERSGVTKTIRVVPHVYLPPTPIIRNRINLNDPIRYTFYTIGEMNARKSILDVVSVFCKTFTAKDSVRLIVKTHYKDYTSKSIRVCEDQIAAVAEQFPDSPPVIVLATPLTCQQITALHTIGDCYVSLSKSEGFGLPIFDAFHMGKAIIATGYGGHMDYLGKDFPGLVNYELVPTEGMAGYAGFEYKNGKHEWAQPNLEHASELMRKITNKS